MCKNPQVDNEDPAAAELMARVAATVSRQAAAVSGNVYEVILRDIPELHDDKAVLSLLASSVDSNVGTCLQMMQHQIELSAVRAPSASLEYARRRAQRGTPLTALLRAYRLGHTCFSDWVLRELARQTSDVALLTATMLAMSRIVAGYVDQTSEEIVAACTRERENWLRNRSAARAARIRDLLSGQRVNVTATEATLGYRLHQYHVSLVCWAGDATAGVDNITRLEHAIGHVAEKAGCSADPVFLPGTNPARGPGCHSAPGTRSTPRRPARAAWTTTSISPSAARPRTPPGFASPTSRPSRPRPSRSPRNRRRRVRSRSARSHRWR
jgi:hypothetical protein